MIRELPVGSPSVRTDERSPAPARPVSTGKFPVVELFGPTIQGEGALAGQVSFFLRTGFCSYKCLWCDSMHAVDPKQVKKNASYMTAREIFEALVLISSLGERSKRDKHRPWVTLTGGDPVLWDQTELVSLLYFGGFRVAVETQGSL